MENAQVRQELYLRRKYEKPRQDVGVFYGLNNLKESVF